MAINVTKPSVNLREKLNELETNKGLKGNEILQAETAQEVRSLIGAGRKNLIINGGFDVWQRGTTGTDPSNGYGSYLSADRWASYFSGTILSQQAVTIDGLPVYAMRITAGTSGNIYAYQKVERGSSIVSGKPITYSFWARANVARSQGMSGRFYDSGTQGTALNLSLSSLDITTSWQKFTQTVTLTDTALNNSRDFFINFQGTFASADWLEVANFQLELGSVATDFEHRSYGEELALCQRYYKRYIRTAGDINYSVYLGISQSMTTTTALIVIPLLHPMRGAPSFSSSAANAIVLNNGAARGSTALSGDVSSSTLGVVITTTGLVANEASRVYLSVGAWIAFDAEL